MDDVFLDPAAFSAWIEQVAHAWTAGALDAQMSTLASALGGADAALAQASATTAGLFSHAADGGLLDASAELSAVQRTVSSAAGGHQAATEGLSADARTLAEEIHQVDLDRAAAFSPAGGGS